jgi:dUTP pyrophosphatase
LIEARSLSPVICVGFNIKEVDVRVLLKRLHPNARIPIQASGSAGFDLYACEPGVIPPGQRINIKLGFKASFESGYAAVIDDRGSTGNAGICHFAGVIDANYRGEWILIMYNSSATAFEYTPDKAIAQCLFLRVESPIWMEVNTLDETSRGEGKFGSTGH